MTSLDISSIKDTTLKNIAVYADSNADKKLDQRELSLFVRKAVNSNCDKNAIAEVCNQVGIEHASDELKATMEKLNQLQKLEKMIKEQENIIKQNNKELAEIYKSEDNKSTRNKVIKTACYGSSIAGAAFAGAKFGSLFGVQGAVIGAIVGIGMGVLIGDSAADTFAPKTHGFVTDDRYEQLEQAKNKINELESKMREVKLAMY